MKWNQGSMREIYLRSRINILFNSERNIVRTKPLKGKSIKLKSSHKFTHSKASAENVKIKGNSPLLFQYRLNYPFIGLLKVKKKELKKEIRIYSPLLWLVSSACSTSWHPLQRNVFEIYHIYTFSFLNSSLFLDTVS